MANAFKYLTSVLFAAIVVQVALAGYGVFYGLHKAKHDQSASLKTLDHGFSAHAVLGSAIAAVILLLLIAALAGRLGPAALKWSGGLLVLALLQFPFAMLGRSVPVLGFLHVVNALAIYAAAALLAHRTWTTRADPPATAA
jgi:Family of unknown function (DUF6220)